MKKLMYCIFIFFLFIFVLYSETTDTYIPKEKRTKNDYYIPGNEGDIIYSIAEGIVRDLSFNNNKGLFLIVDYKSIGLKVTYCNLKSTFVLRDQKIKKGNKLCSIGMTGYTLQTGCNIIIEVDEQEFLFQKKNLDY